MDYHNLYYRSTYYVQFSGIWTVLRGWRKAKMKYYTIAVQVTRFWSFAWTFQCQKITKAPYRTSCRRNVPCLQGEWQEKFVVPASGWTENFVVSTVFGQALMPTPLPIQ
jgi:hypothetical protein